MADDIAVNILSRVSDETEDMGRGSSDAERIDYSITWLGFVVAEAAAEIIRTLRATDGHADDQPGSGDGR